MDMENKTRQTRECEKCGHSLKFIQFKDETKKTLTCPDCGWRKEKSGAASTTQFPAVLTAECLFTLDPFKCSIVLTTAEGARSVVAANVESFGRATLDKLRSATLAYFGRNVRIDYTQMRVTHAAGTLHIVANRNITASSL